MSFRIDAADAVGVELKWSFMTTPSNPWGDEGKRGLHHLCIRDQVLSGRQARRMSRRFAGVGVGIPAARLQEIAAGARVGDDELADVNFALAATEIEHEERIAKFERSQRRGIQWLIVAGVVLVILNFLLCMAYILFRLAQHASPF